MNEEDQKLADDSLNDPDPDWISEGDENLSAEVPGKGAFKSTVYLSTDGKNTVTIEADTDEGRKRALKWAKLTYDRIRAVYGTKQSQSVKEYGKATNGNTNVCPLHKVPMKERQGQNGTFYSHAKQFEGEWMYCNGKGWKGSK